MFRKLTFASPVVAWAIFVAGLLAMASAWQTRHPDTTSDFTLFYVSAQQTTAQMFAHPPGPPRGNMNPPLFQLLLVPLTHVSLPTAAAIWRGLNLASLAVSLWWLARTSSVPWTIADVGLLLAWAPMACTISLNQLTWILWPLLLLTWECWRRDRWSQGGVVFGLALSLKPFLGVFLLWLLVQRRWKAVVVSCLSAAGAFGVGLAWYGLDVTRAWIVALGDVTWAHSGMNASWQGLLARALTMPVQVARPIAVLPAMVKPLALVGGLLIVGATLLRTRERTIERSWTAIMSSALLASPLGWLYYIWWVMPGVRPTDLFFEAPLLWIPLTFPILLAPSGLLTVTLGSTYFWGLIALWLAQLSPAGADDRTTSTNSPAFAVSHFGLASMAIVSVVVGGSAVAHARQSVTTDPAVGTWVLDRSRSTFSPDAPIVSRTITYMVEGDVMKESTVTQWATADAIDHGDRLERLDYRGRYDGLDIDVAYGFPPTVAMTRVDARTVRTVGKSRGEIVETRLRTVSEDGRTLTITTEGSKETGAYRSVQIFKRLP